MEDAKASKISILSYPIDSHERAVKAYGIEVKAPTGHKSIIYPIIHH